MQGKQELDNKIFLILGIVFLFTPLFIIGVLLLILYAVFNTTSIKNLDDLINYFKNEFTEDSYKETETYHETKHNSNENEVKKDIQQLPSSTSSYNENKHEEVRVDSVKQINKPIQQVSAHSNRCPVCRSENKKGEKHCTYCGELLIAGIICPFCKTNNERRASKCKNCGTPLDSGQGRF